MTEFFTVTLIIILAAASPGPDFFIVVKNAITNGRKFAILTGVGISCSLVIHACYCLLGLTMVITHSLFLFNCIKYIGAAYLIYLGLVSLLSKQGNDTHIENVRGAATLFNAFLQGFLCNLLNPKAILFILAFFTLVVKPQTSWIVKMAYGMEIVLVSLIWFSLLSLIITHDRIKTNLSKIQHYIVKAMGIVLIGFGSRIAFLAQVIT
jgi:RhtB (resistance to homoserine/threonine) family protein